MVKAKRESALARLKRDAGLGKEDLGNQTRLGAGLARKIPEGLQTILYRGLSRLKAEERE